MAHLFPDVLSGSPLGAWQVNDAYRGTLSSYGYVLMCIHLLQQRQPPVLPCLHSIRPHTHVRYQSFGHALELCGSSRVCCLHSVAGFFVAMQQSQLAGELSVNVCRVHTLSLQSKTLSDDVAQARWTVGLRFL